MFDKKSWFVSACALLLCVSEARGEPALPAAKARRSELIREAVSKSPSMRAAAHRESAAKLRAKATGSLPDPELMLEVWQIPITRPYAVNDAGMVMVGVKQAVPAPGSLSLREGAVDAEARIARAERDEAARKLSREVGHAFADYLEATAMHHVHQRHVAVAQRVLAVSKARYAAGGLLTDVSQSEVEISRSRADAAGEGSRLKSIERRLNALASRPLGASLGPPADEGAWSVTLSADEITERALTRRPDVAVARAKRGASEAEQRVLDRESTAPSFSVGGLYFPPTNGMTEHGYGASLSVSMPWIWGGSRARKAAQRHSTAAANAELEQARLDISAEVAMSLATVEGALERLKVLKRETLPASQRNLEFSLAGYETGGTSLVTLLTAQRDVVDVELEIILARAVLDHALTDLDFAAGSELPKRRVKLEGN